MEPEPQIAKPSPASKPKNNLTLPLILVSIIALAGIGLGIYGFFFKKPAAPAQNTDTSNLESELSSLKQKYSVLQNYVKELEASGTEVSEEVKSATSAETIATEDYIYVGEWGIKIKIPENLEIYHYDYHPYQESNVIGSDGTAIKTSSLCIGAATTNHGSDYSSFANKCMYTLNKNIGQAADDEESFWQYKIPSGEFYHIGPQALLGDESQKEWEVESVNAIREWLSDESARSAI